MKRSFQLFTIIAIAAALGFGWFFESRTAQTTKIPLQIPDNIDYYLTNVKYRSMNQQGELHYFLKAPFLEHYIREDISHLQQPTIQFNADNYQWLIQAKTGRLKHKEVIFELNQQVALEKKSPLDPMLLTANLMIIKPQVNLVEIPQNMIVTTNNLHLQAASAELDMQQNRYKFKQVKATYQQEKS